METWIFYCGSECVLGHTWLYPEAQLFPAPPPCLDRQMFSGLYRLAYGEFMIVLMTRGSRSNRTALGMQCSSSAYNQNNNESNIVKSPSGFVVNIMHCDIFKLYFCFLYSQLSYAKLFFFGFRIRVFMDLIFRIVVVFSKTFCE